VIGEHPNLVRLSHIHVGVVYQSSGRIGIFDAILTDEAIEIEKYIVDDLVGKNNLLRKLIIELVNRVLEERYVDYGVQNVNGFRKGRSNISNAVPHVGKPIVVSVDVRDFFPSISKQLLRSNLQKVLKELNLANPYITGYFLAELLSYKGGLPAGSPISPLLSNLCMFSTDVELMMVSKKWNLNFTRYADDITVSGADESAKKFIVVIRKELNKIGLQLNFKKTTISRSGRRQKVCGLNVNTKVSLSRQYRRSIRAASHSMQNAKEPHLNGNLLSLAQLRGHVSYIKAVMKG